MMLQIIEGYENLTDVLGTFYAQRNNFFKYTP